MVHPDDDRRVPAGRVRAFSAVETSAIGPVGRVHGFETRVFSTAVAYPSDMDRDAAVDRAEALVEAVATERMPVPVREIWVYGDIALGVDPVDRLDVYLTKDVLLEDDSDLDAADAPDPDAIEAEHGIEGIGSTVRADWAAEHPDYLRANPNGYAAPERCLAAHLLGDDEPIHLEVCNTGFEDNVTQRLRGAVARDAYEQLLDPRGVCLWVDGVRSETAFEKLRESALPFPTLSDALEQLGLEDEEAERAAKSVHAWRDEQEGVTVRGDVV